ncbi:MAG: cadherin-like beta sandwich domain-containing protein, partial [Dehalococcoidia bacterium]|nr:cadherin-like beta sandwich domain-containing protein [Dehalococcoidia bacterium]
DQPWLIDATLRELTLTGPHGASIALTPSFDPLVFTYAASAPNNFATTSVAVTKSYGGAALQFVGTVGAVQTGNTYEVEYSLDVGDNLVEVAVTSADGSETKTYTVTVTREASDDATLSSFELLDADGAVIDLTPEFDSATEVYSASVPSGVESVVLTTTKSHAGAAALIILPSGMSAPDEATADLAAGDNLIKAMVTAEDGNTVKTYMVTVERAEPEWSATLTVGTTETYAPASTGHSEWDITGSALSSDEFTFGGTEYRVILLFNLSEGLYFTLNKKLPSDFTLRIGDYEYAGRDSYISRSRWKGNYWWGDSGFSWTPGETVEVSLSIDRAPLPAREQAPPSAYFTRIPDINNGLEPLEFRLNFTRDVDITAAELRDHALVVGGGTVREVERISGRRVWLITVEPDSSAVVTVSLYEAATCEEQGAICTGSGERLHNYPTLTVQAQNPAGGAPAITGTAQVGRTLTDDTSRIVDADSLSNVTYGYLWVRNGRHDRY